MVALLGLPNVGKSTLLNRLADKKISIATHKAQTTRQIIYHRLPSRDGAMVFMDTPGLFAPKVKRDLYQMAWGAAQKADILLLMIDGTKPAFMDNQTNQMIKALSVWRKPIALALNKIDIAPERQIVSITKQWMNLIKDDLIFHISARKAMGLDYLHKGLLAHLPPSRQIAIEKMADEIYASEILREKILLYIHKELPWQARVETIHIKEKNDILAITQKIMVGKDRHKAIFLGKGGSKLKMIGQAARFDMEAFFKRKIYLSITIEICRGMA